VCMHACMRSVVVWCETRDVTRPQWCGWRERDRSTRAPSMTTGEVGTSTRTGRRRDDINTGACEVCASTHVYLLCTSRSQLFRLWHPCRLSHCSQGQRNTHATPHHATRATHGHVCAARVDATPVVVAALCIASSIFSRDDHFSTSSRFISIVHASTPTQSTSSTRQFSYFFTHFSSPSSAQHSIHPASISVRAAWLDRA
jgi:hypothetical protein